MMTWDQLRTDLERALQAHFPAQAESILREVERRHFYEPGQSDATDPHLPSLVRLAEAVESCFPDRAPRILEKLRRVLEPVEERGRMTRRGELELTRVGGSVDHAPTLVIVWTDLRGWIGRGFPLERGRMRVGRSPESDVSLPDPSVSRRHFEIRVEGGEFLIADQRSLNGTFLNGKPLEPLSDTILRSGDRLTVAKIALRFLC